MTYFNVDLPSQNFSWGMVEKRTLNLHDEDRDRNTKQYSVHVFNKVGKNNGKAALIKNKTIS